MYEHKKFTVKVKKILNELNDFKKIIDMLIVKSIVIKFEDSYNNYNFQVLIFKHRKLNKKSANFEKQIIKNDDDVIITKNRFKKNIVKKKNKKKTIKSIFDIIDKSKVNVKIILFHNTIILFVIHLYQISLYFRNKIKRFIQVSRKLRRKKKEKKND